jgi:hypothetical protein
MYESPVDLLMANIQTQIIEQQEEAIYKAVFDIGVNVTKDELLRALAYDRQQYEIGFAEGMAAAKPVWIPVTERLPESKEKVLVYGGRTEIWFNGTKQPMPSIHTGYLRGLGEGWFSWDHHDYICDVTHWMPLPEPPKEML